MQIILVAFNSCFIGRLDLCLYVFNVITPYQKIYSRTIESRVGFCLFVCFLYVFQSGLWKKINLPHFPLQLSFTTIKTLNNDFNYKIIQWHYCHCFCFVSLLNIFASPGLFCELVDLGDILFYNYQKNHYFWGEES